MIDQRLRHIMEIYEPFGGLIVIFFGHFKQLGPVKNVLLYKIPKDSLEGAVLQDGTIILLWNQKFAN